MKRILIYLVTTFGLTWTFWSIGISGPVVMGMPVAELAAAGLGMFGPSAGVLAVWIVTRSEGGLDLPLHPRFQGNGRWYLTAWFAPALAVLLGCLLYTSGTKMARCAPRRHRAVRRPGWLTRRHTWSGHRPADKEVR